MSTNEQVSAKVQDHYSVSAQTYTNHYDKDNLYTSPTYPAEYFRLVNLVESLRTFEPSRVLDAGCGEGTPLLWVAELGCDVRGFDFTAEMVDAGKKNFEENGRNPAEIIEADVEKFETFEPLLEGRPFDAAVCFGVMPHVNDEDLALKNLRKSVRTGGKVFVEFRNALFNLWTFNRYTHAYMGDLFSDVPKEIWETTGQFVEGRLDMNVPPLRLDAEAGKPGYDAIKAKMHNPIDMHRLFKEAGLSFDQIHWYHFHPTLPMLEGNGVSPEAFRNAAFEMEKNPGDPRGVVLCSAYVVEATAV